MPLAAVGPFAQGASKGPTTSAPTTSKPTTSPTGPSTVAPAGKPVSTGKPTPTGKPVDVTKPAAFAPPTEVKDVPSTQARPLSAAEIQKAAKADLPNSDVGELDEMFTDSSATRDEADGTKDETVTDEVTADETVTDETKDEPSFTVDEESAPDDVTPDDTKTSKRDYSKYDPEVAAILKKLPNTLFAKYADQIAEWKESHKKVEDVTKQLDTLKAEKPRFLAEHPESYRIAPEYKSAQLNHRAAKMEARHWENQLIAINNGEAWREFLGYDETGNARFQDHPAPENGRVDQRAAIAVQQALTRASMEEIQAKNAMTDISQNYGAYQQQATTDLIGMRQKLFKVDPEKLTGKDAQNYKAAIDMLPGAFADNPLAPFIGLTHVHFRKLLERTQQLDKELKALKGGKQTPKPAVGPRGHSGAGLPNGKAALSWDEFDPTK